MRTLLPFLQGRWTKFYSLALTCFIILFSKNLICSEDPKEKQKTLGILETYVQLSKTNKSKAKETLNKLKKKPVINLNDIESINLHSTYLRSLFFFSKNNFLNLISNNQCNFFSLLENKLLGRNLKLSSLVPIIIKKKDGGKESGTISLSEIIDFIYKQKCPKQKENSTLFSTKHFEKTFSKFNFEVSKNEISCLKTHNNFIKNPDFPYLCKIPQFLKMENKFLNDLNQEMISLEEEETISDLKITKLYKKSISIKDKFFLENLCKNINSGKKFCSLYTAKDVWTKVLNKELPKFKILHKCKQILGEQASKEVGLAKCAKLLKSKPNLCATRGSLGKTVLFPTPKCTEISESLKKGNLITKYHDCPSKVFNQSITNVSRIILHFSDNNSKDGSIDNCSFETMKTFSKGIYSEDIDELWPMKICYKSRLSKKNTCLSYLPGYDKKSPISENKVLEKILKKTQPVLNSLKCYISNKKSFNPSRIALNDGCHVFYDFNNCNDNKCLKRIIVNNKNIKNINYNDDPNFYYFPEKVYKDAFSSINFLKNNLNINQVAINNLNQIRKFLIGRNKVIHGVGCIQNIYPRHFKLRSMNQCKPTTFIIDNIIEKNKNIYLSTRTSIDDIHSPRLIHWSFIYNSLKTYQNVHSTKSWTLYGLQKNN